MAEGKKIKITQTGSHIGRTEDQRGTLIGLTRGSTRAHVARAALESIAFQSADLIEAMQQDCGHALAELRVDGGAARNDLLMQFQADLLGVPVLRPVNTETTAFGAATGTGFVPTRMTWLTGSLTSTSATTLRETSAPPRETVA